MARVRPEVLGRPGTLKRSIPLAKPLLGEREEELQYGGNHVSPVDPLLGK
jgi:hypothetical protein